ncbi:uncharacterized protein LOC127290326 isoform X3 [Leptopilina boulardi]|uniref:uncharacterized protein LOC127290326 isoform X1 n=1 Tax=Leptopilina boulardi TaxID=63433 RepID=UPI0021F51F88|nr:uncharacterized protein LOC127290326 isoform X1 [Leptopilina boulardi]XP_051174783.1 uncharacterized protein LOC127290326 isoform X3 [Leptopilina boulardi]
MKLTISVISFILYIIINNYQLVSGDDMDLIYGIKSFHKRSKAADKCVISVLHSLLSRNIYFTCIGGFRRFDDFWKAEEKCIRKSASGRYYCNTYLSHIGLEKREDIEAECIVKEKESRYICLGRKGEVYTSKKKAEEICIKEGNNHLYYCNSITEEVFTKKDNIFKGIRVK